MDRLERLVNLLAALIETTRPLSREDVRRRVPGYSGSDETFRRAFERDKETLRAMGVALMTEPLDPDYPEHGDGYRVPPDKYALADPGLTREEMDALALAASSVKLKGDAAAAALQKLGRGPTPGADPQLPTAVQVELNDDERLTQFFSARSERRTVTFGYKDKVRTVDPYRLSFRNGHWYVNGFDHDHNDARTYRLDRISGDIGVSEPSKFIAPAPVDQPWLPPWQMGDEVPVQAVLKVDASQADLAVAQSGSEAVLERSPDGSVLIQLRVTNRDGLRAFILGFLNHAELLSPPNLRSELIEYLRALAAS